GNVDRRKGGCGARHVSAMGYFKVTVSNVVIADEASTVGSYNRRRRRAYVIGHSVHCCAGGGGAGQVGAVGHLEVAVGRVVVADEREAVGPDSHGGGLANATGRPGVGMVG